MKWLALVAALAPGLCSAEPVWFLGAGAGIAERDYGVPPFDMLELQYDDGTPYHVEGGGRFDSNLLLRGTYAYTHYQRLTALGTLIISENVAQRELRLGGFYAPRPLPWLGWRAGAGYATFGDPSAGTSQGVFAELAAVFHVGNWLALDLSAARQMLDGDAHDGDDLRLAFTFETDNVYVTLAGRWMEMQPEDELADYRLTLGRSWGGPR